jgi:hypothetical protein
VTRAKSNFDFKRLYSRPVDKSTGAQSDQTIELKGFYPKKDYPIYAARADNRRTVSAPLESGAIFQMDQMNLLD